MPTQKRNKHLMNQRCKRAWKRRKLVEVVGVFAAANPGCMIQDYPENLRKKFQAEIIGSILSGRAKITGHPFERLIA